MKNCRSDERQFPPMGISRIIYSTLSSTVPRVLIALVAFCLSFLPGFFLWFII